MARHSATAEVPNTLIEPQHRCMVCDGVIANVSDEVFSIGLDLRLGLVSDKCALICNDCTTKLIETRKLQERSANGIASRQ